MCKQLTYKFARGADGVIELEIVLGAGGVKGYFHIGFLKGLSEFCAETGTRIRITKVTGVSVGAIIAALFTNGWSWERILQLFVDSHDRSGNPLLLASAFAVPNLRSFLVGRSFLSLERPWEKFVKEYGLTGNDRLRIVAADSSTHEAVVFEGHDYNLGRALSASGSLPGVFLPVAYGDRLLIDGAAHHRNPDQFCSRPALISALGFARTWPREVLDGLSFYYHMREVYAPVIKQPTAVDENRHVHVLHAADDVCGLSFSLSKQRCLLMVDQGCANIKAALYQACADSQIEGCNPKQAA